MFLLFQTDYVFICASNIVIFTHGTCLYCCSVIKIELERLVGGLQGFFAKKENIFFFFLVYSLGILKIFLN